ncbi:phage holin [Paenilisteria rocourtiae]|uniref:Phi LC3 family holin n=1 Tax=Listeria rocourtiae TaxID=647910 RepID=A0A4R6ZRR4_9LIST|nr:phage holin [Listeria rocourtiae]EUJ44417.1 holin, phage phi LC3 [Listeria rocourtiae FSL F6-920]TDR55102.1 phi LC3 family holin [Listeria rocourtiae]
MKKINWRVRFKNRAWVVAMIAALFFIAQSVLIVFGISWDYTTLFNQIVVVVGAVFALVGLVIDPTTAGTPDSERAMRYEEPRKDEE